MRALHAGSGKEKHHSRFIGQVSNEVEFAFAGLFLFYKEFFSSQDLPGTCNFHPSCSEFGMLCVRKRGVLPGIAATFDRLMRCNTMNDEEYDSDPDSGRYLDFP